MIDYELLEPECVYSHDEKEYFVRNEGYMKTPSTPSTWETCVIYQAIHDGIPWGSLFVREKKEFCNRFTYVRRFKCLNQSSK
jgi:hypothetical protein